MKVYLAILGSGGIFSGMNKTEQRFEKAVKWMKEIQGFRLSEDSDVFGITRSAHCFDAESGLSYHAHLSVPSAYAKELLTSRTPRSVFTLNKSRD